MGAVALAAFAVHGAVHLVRHEAHEVLWSCNMSALVIGLGGLLVRGEVIAVGLSWLSLGIPLWLLDLAMGGPLMISSLLTHVVAPICAVDALRRVGWPRATWWRATLALAALLVLTRWVTPPRANVNLAFRVWPGWEWLFASHRTYIATLTLATAALFFCVERVALWLDRARVSEAAAEPAGSG